MQKAVASLLVVGVAFGASYWAYVVQTRPAPEVVPPLMCKGIDPLAELSCRTPVATNRGRDVVDGFQGEVHPFLHAKAELDLKAFWVAPDIDHLDRDMPPSVQRLYREVRAAMPSKRYSERDFSPLLPPEGVRNAGQAWAIDPAKFTVFLKQFHPAVSTNSASVGRRPGPNGAFAVLRGVSDTHLDVALRVHAEFDLLPKPGDFLLIKAWYSPACFLGRVVVNRSTGAVEYFQLGVPTEKITNVHITCWRDSGDNGGHAHNMHRVERMELVGGKLALGDIHWTSQIELAQAHDNLAKVFYKFKEINFLPFDKTLAAARAQRKPIFAMVLLGSLDDQSC